MRFFFFGLGTLLAATAVTACVSVESAPSSAPTGGTEDAGSGGSGSGATFTCADILTCAEGCSDEDQEACEDACLARGSGAAQGAATALVSCITREACEDTACTQEKCASELAACVEQSAASADGGVGTPRGEALPVELVGSWSTVSSQSAFNYDFAADGATIFTGIIETHPTSTCTSRLEISTRGVTTVNGDQLVYHRREGTHTSTYCGGTPKTSSASPGDQSYTYALGKDEDGRDTLTLVGSEDASTTYVRGE